ncbi:pyruvate:ferredoxin (flavodoxin) oxidoreductase [Prevotella lacticifex]|jgi:pyruvate-ferredoxin/flavodoxin oxidoreductase|uniref:Pyruvate-flavodoxin oxidoreductase n=1 Tax=Prevotella lacticifex TaxID=2854755 RepID=A0A9R1CA59_9BACT|nr:pyruvate:ferredoxin (flavodoxin) oxidoreductase [Prevotella lacticifex]GJG35603.1 pyruvate-flavodoxin oxidoreductase [Prevotella lacticifex]GJG39349.1 pyruvate-flavodoxin oxidoreductase [Prevotella lacticifex]GJG41971.1 pyruvate-flavodoxin oxidoreductase [Prevotella lacticifex]GJG45703.1 pyruvate-flavodoxin oxidoreductase [Prevotella lacticifex]GJG48322.1 pyruvate-flavodoxin oxidoreductase [Prevotella lacticifex]
MAKEKKFVTCDGNTAAAHVSYMFTEVAAIYPITPSSPMAEHVDEWAAKGRKNLFGQTVSVQEMESEGGAAGAVHGSLQAGALTSTYTASQGLLLMIPNMYKIAGELLPCVFNVSARTLASHSLCIFGDHQDVMACRQTGFAMFCSGSVQEVMDLTAVPYLATLETEIPFINFFDGFRTSHEYHKVEEMDQEDIRPLLNMDYVKRFRDRALTPERPVTRGTAENPETFFTHREACNEYYDKVPAVVEKYLGEISKITGREYHLFNYYGAADAENIIVLMGSATEPAREAIDYLNKQGKKVGMVAVHLYRPFSVEAIRKAIPDTVKRIAVLDRTKEPGAEGEPLYLDVKSALYDDPRKPLIVGGRYGLGSNDTTPAKIVAVFNNLELPEPKNHFTVGIVDDVTFTSLPEVPEIPMGGDSLFEAKFYGLGSDGTVGANKNSVQIIGNNTNKYCQAYFSYDSKKSGGFTCSHLRFGDDPIHSAYLVNTPNFVACHVQAYLHMYDVTRGLRDNGTFLLNTIFDGEELVNFIPNHVKKYFAKHNIKVYYINASKIGREIGLGNRTNTILQSAFFRITKVIPEDLAVEQMKKFIVKSYGKKGEDIVNMNYAAVDRGGEYKELTVDPAWANLPEDEAKSDDAPKFVKELVRPMNAQAGDLLKVSDFVKNDTVDGTWQNGTAAFEKRGVEAMVPVWNPENCIQCNKCAFVCPHAAIRPFVLDDKEAESFKGTTLEVKAPKALKGMHFRIEVSVLDCLGCGNCADVCMGKNRETGEKALKMVPFNVDAPDMVEEAKNWDWLVKNVKSKQDLVDIKQSPKNSQFATPLFEFSGACSGCGETPYVKLISQLFGDREMIANATGCSSIYSASVPSTPYTTNEKGQGPAFDNSLFEDFCEFGLGMALGNKKMKSRITMLLNEKIADDKTSDEFKAAAQQWIDNQNDAEGSKAAAAVLKPLIEKDAAAGCDVAKELKTLDHYLVKRSQWIIGGDGASYDIGYGGLDHVLASGEDVNILVLDTEVYSNTGGQSSKSTPLGAIAQFAAAGKRVSKKDLGLMETTYGYIYVAQVAMGADNAQTLKAIREAEAYPGPSLVIAYAPCINHGIKGKEADGKKRGMNRSQHEEELAVQCGYWHLWRFNPELAKEGKNPFQLDSKAPKWENFRDYLMGEVRFASLKKVRPEEAEELYAETEKAAKRRYQSYIRKSQEDWSESI